MKSTQFEKMLSWLVSMLTLVGTLGFLTACSAQISSQDFLLSVLETEEGCDSLCWNGLIPGKSTEDDFLTLVDSSKSQKFRKLKRFTWSLDEEGYIWTDRSVSTMMNMVLKNGVVQELSLTPYGSEPELGEVLDILGPPNAYTASIETREQTLLAIQLFYEEQGVVIEIREIPYLGKLIDTEYGCMVDWHKKMLVKELHFVEPGSAEQMYNVLPTPVLQRSRSLVNWRGSEQLEVYSCGWHDRPRNSTGQ